MMDDGPTTTPNSGIQGSPRSPEGAGGLWSRLKALIAPAREAVPHAGGDGVPRVPNGEAPGNGHAEARSMMSNLIAFTDLKISDVMVPRADITAIDGNATARELLNRFTDANHSRLPVYRETLDDPSGMVHVKDFLRWMTERSFARPRRGRRPKNPEEEINPGMVLRPEDLAVTVRQTGLIRPLLFVPPSMRAADLLVKMQTTRIHMAIVVDEYGGTDGLVSIEDLVEEIVGDIADEHDEAEAQLREAGEGVYVADARTPIEDVESLVHRSLLPAGREEDADTLGGLVFSMLGRVPVRGELVRHDSGLEFEILEADPRRVKKIRIHTGAPAEAPAAPSPELEPPPSNAA
jgi:CBS domain containing-hemolysin-like protein